MFSHGFCVDTAAHSLEMPLAGILCCIEWQHRTVFGGTLMLYRVAELIVFSTMATAFQSQSKTPQLNLRCILVQFFISPTITVSGALDNLLVAVSSTRTLVFIGFFWWYHAH